MVSFNALLVLANYLLSGNLPADSDTPEVTLGKARIVGHYDATNDVDAFLGVRYASAKRFERAAMVHYKEEERINATVHAPACAQINSGAGFNKYGVVEDCTYLEIYRPHDNSDGTPLPVMVWLHGGGGTYGAASAWPGFKFVKQAQDISLPVILVTVNYRLAVWGNIGGREAAQNKAENLALYDQRTALEWVQKHIGGFGGDKTKVTLIGASSGSMNTQYHYLTENTHLFRAGIMQSGGVSSVPALPAANYQYNYDAFVAAVGCKSAVDTFACLKEADFSTLQEAVDLFMSAPQIYSTRPWGISIDGEIVPDVPSILVAKGRFAKKPFIHGNVLDEGTFSPQPTPMNTVVDMWSFYHRDYLRKSASFLSNQTTLDKLLQLYPEDPAAGSPFGTGDELFGQGKQFKRAAAMSGDIRYQAVRRAFLNDALKAGIKSWSYQLSQFTPILPATYGVYHSLDTSYIFLQLDESDTEYYNLAKLMHSYWVSFAHNLNPNYPGNPSWPNYNKPNGPLLEFTAAKTSVISDTYREEAISFINSIPEQFGAPRK